jgi:hypothetical protein
MSLMKPSKIGELIQKAEAAENAKEWQQIGFGRVQGSPQRQRRTDEVLAYRTNPEGRGFGVCFGAVGLLGFVLSLCAALFPDAMNTRGNPIAPMILFGLFAIAGYFIAVYTYDLRIDPATRTYQARYGHWPLVKQYEGPFDNFASLDIVYSARRKGMADNWPVYLYWKGIGLRRFMMANGSSKA